MLAAVLAAGFAVADRSGVLDWLENKSADWRVRLTVDPRRADRDIAVIDIDNASFRALTDKLGRWPWTRRVWTELIRYVSSGKPRLIVFDAIFSGPEPGADEGFAAVLRAAGNVVLPFAFVSGEIDTGSGISAPPSSAMPSPPMPAAELPSRQWSVSAPHPLLASAASFTGANLWTPDRDGITRLLPLAMQYDGRKWASFWLAAAMRAGATNPDVPLNREGRFAVRWHGDSLTSYPLVPLWEMICSIYPQQCEASVKRHPAEEFGGKIVIVGASAAGSYEVRPTPVSETAPGFFVIATAIDNLLHNDGIHRAPVWFDLLAIVFLAAVPAWSVLAYRGVLAPLAIIAAALAAYGVVCVFLYSRALQIPMAAPMLAGATGFTAHTVLRYLLVDRELSRTRGTLERYVSPQLVRHVMDNLETFRFDGEKKKLTIFFSDVRSFTTLTEKSDPTQLLAQLNEYLEAMTDIIFQHDGIVDKFIGDGVMAHWGAFTPEKPNARLAAQASLKMMLRLAELNVKWEQQGYPPLDIGIGLNTAEVIFGNVGTGKKSDFTAIGDGVNLAARLESANKEYKTHIIISESTLEELGSTAKVRPLGSVVVKGKTVGVTIYELLDAGVS